MGNKPAVPTGNPAEASSGGGAAASAPPPGGGGATASGTGANKIKEPYVVVADTRGTSDVYIRPVKDWDGKWTYFGPAPTSGDKFAGVRAVNPPDTVYPPPPPDTGNNQSTQVSQGPTGAASSFDAEQAPYDSRLLFIGDVGENGEQSIIYSFSSKEGVVANLVDGFIYGDPEQEGKSIVASDSTDDGAKKNNPKMVQFEGVPAIMNEMQYINIQGAGGKLGNALLRETENKPRWYDTTSRSTREDANKLPISATAELTVKDLISWSKGKGNIRFPYRFQDFVFCKWWKKIPLNYMITLRRYTRPVIDAVATEFDVEYDTPSKEVKMIPAATAVTFLGEDPGNKISAILGNIEAGLKWRDIKADVWQVTSSSEPSQADSPMPGLAKLFALVTNENIKGTQAGMQPPDPYQNGPYANKIIGPITVIDSTKARERGVTFKHEIKLQFEYVSRSIGGINPKAAMLDIISHFMILTYNTAAFWGGENRHMPHAGHAGPGPFLGGKEGRSAFLRGDPQGFYKAVMNQFNSAMDIVGDFFKDLMGDPVATLLGAEGKGGGVVDKAMKQYMKLNTTQGRGQTQGMHSLLTGAPIGEWHLTVGNPMNPMMMIGNLICTGIKIDFNDELGPDDFPTEVKFTVSLEHGMPRDKSGIESMFNKGQGRLYALPDGRDVTDTFASFDQSAIDSSLKGKSRTGDPQAQSKSIYYASPQAAGQQRARDGVGTSYNSYRGGAISANPLLGDNTVWDSLYGFFAQASKPRVRAEYQAVYSNGTKPPSQAGYAAQQNEKGNAKK
jgi:hypothetical protein